jgi:hypothetical protein
MTVSRRGQPWNMYPSHCSTHILSKVRKVEVVEAKVNAQQEKAGVHHCSQTEKEWPPLGIPPQGGGLSLDQAAG